MSNPDVMNRTTPPPIPTPPGFPVIWDDPDDERLFWTRERLHFPEQMSRLNYALLEGMWLHGWWSAAAAYEMPAVGPRARLINTYYYSTMVPIVVPPDEMEARAKRCQEKLGAAVARLGELWHTEWLPEVKRHLRDWETFDLRGADAPALRAHLEETLTRYTRLYEIHFLVGFPLLVAMSLFEDLHRELFGNGGALDAYRLLQGFDTRTFEAERALFMLSRQARAVPEVREVLELRPASEVPMILQRSDDGRAFLASLRSYLERYGRRAPALDIARPTHLEDPTPIVQSLKEYVVQPDRDPSAAMAELATERERLVAEARARLRGYPQPIVGQFELLLRAAREGIVLQEDHTFELEDPCNDCVRRVMLECGRRLVEAGALERPDDVFHLTLDELRQALDAPSAIDRRSLVAERQAEMERFKDVAPPPVLGTLPPGPPPDSPFTRVSARFFGAPPQPSTDPHVLRGMPGSSGTARGPARVVRSLAEARKLRPGDILVAETTLPTWTPLFARAAAVVTDAGGVLSHAALVAREYRIPAVVATGRATTAIRDGQMVEVDGDAGEVGIVSAV